MDPIRSILAIVDPTAEAQPAVDKAARLAARLEARLELYVCDTRAARELRLAKHYRERPREPFRTDLKGLLEGLAEPLRRRGVDVTTEVESADPLHLALIEKSRRTAADLVVKDTHHHSLAQRTLLTHTDWELIRACPTPLLLVKPPSWRDSPQLLAAVDPWHANDKPAMLDHRILEHAALLARGLRGQLHLLHAYMPVAFMAAAIATASPAMIDISPDELAAERRAKLEALVQLAAGFGVSAANVHLEIGSPADWLPRAASAFNVDIVAMGALSRSGLRRAFLGSTAEEVLERLPCDALIIKPLDFAAAWPG